MLHQKWRNPCVYVIVVNCIEIFLHFFLFAKDVIKQIQLCYIRGGGTPWVYVIVLHCLFNFLHFVFFAKDVITIIELGWRHPLGSGRRRFIADYSQSGHFMAL